MNSEFGRDHLDTLLSEYFTPGPTPGRLAARVLPARGRSTAAEELARFERALTIEASPSGVASVAVGGPAARAGSAAARRLVEQAREEISEYLRGQRAFFTVPVDLSATQPFQRQVLEAARTIPFGESRAYAWVAERIGNPRAVRAVGTALGRNPVPLIVPCHRVWRADGALGGYRFGEAVKRGLADLERHTPVLEGSTTTRIVCRVGCVHGRQLRPENRVVFASVEDARSVGYRPCKICRPAA